VSRASEERANILHRLAEKSPDELAELAKQIPMRFQPIETVEDRIRRLLPYVWRGWVEL
jgi:endonuclease YncB( thermonuclease family)